MGSKAWLPLTWPHFLLPSCLTQLWVLSVIHSLWGTESLLLQSLRVYICCPLCLETLPWDVGKVHSSTAWGSWLKCPLSGRLCLAIVSRWADHLHPAPLCSFPFLSLILPLTRIQFTLHVHSFTLSPLPQPTILSGTQLLHKHIDGMCLSLLTSKMERILSPTGLLLIIIIVSFLKYSKKCQAPC